MLRHKRNTNANLRNVPDHSTVPRQHGTDQHKENTTRKGNTLENQPRLVKQ